LATIQNFADHSEQVQKMANTLGVHLGHAILTDKLHNFPFYDIVFRCSKCSKKSACKAWLEEHSARVTDAPEYCRNKFLLEGLQK
jgi:hypothetical protein